MNIRKKREKNGGFVRNHRINNEPLIHLIQKCAVLRLCLLITSIKLLYHQLFFRLSAYFNIINALMLLLLCKISIVMWAQWKQWTAFLQNEDIGNFISLRIKGESLKRRKTNGCTCKTVGYRERKLGIHRLFCSNVSGRSAHLHPSSTVISDNDWAYREAFHPGCRHTGQ